MPIHSQKNSPCTMHTMPWMFDLRERTDKQVGARTEDSQPESIAIQDRFAAIRSHRRKRIARFRLTPAMPHLKGKIE